LADFVTIRKMKPTVVWNATFGFTVWVFMGWLFCTALLAYFEQDRWKSSPPNESEQYRTNKKITRIGFVGGIILACCWLAHYLMISN